jgi:hypothetical protein
LFLTLVIGIVTYTAAELELEMTLGMFLWLKPKMAAITSPLATSTTVVNSPCNAAQYCTTALVVFISSVGPFRRTMACLRKSEKSHLPLAPLPPFPRVTCHFQLFRPLPDSLNESLAHADVRLQPKSRRRTRLLVFSSSTTSHT